ncbi:DUF664 domain-containing protein [Micromonospora sp. NPDC001898]|uniref:mycothiol transferase n=1 Tax=Micromonospora sp. NPDC001898 TaxID=3364221 RepID=UPI0036825746
MAASRRPRDWLIDLYRRVGVFADQTIEQLPLDAPGRMPWRRPGGQTVMLQIVIVHVTGDLARHAGHADIIRDLHDTAIGLRWGSINIPNDYDWPAYVTKLTKLADRFGYPPGVRVQSR